MLNSKGIKSDMLVIIIAISFTALFFNAGKSIFIDRLQARKPIAIGMKTKASTRSNALEDAGATAKASSDTRPSICEFYTQ